MSMWFFRDGSEAPAHRVTPTTKTGSGTSPRWHDCTRCGGTGGGEQWRYTGWTCFQCNGAKGSTKTVPVYTAEKLAKLVAAAENRETKRAAAAIVAAEKREAKRAALQAAFSTTNAGRAVMAARPFVERNSFIADVVRRADSTSTLTDCQVDALTTAVARLKVADLAAALPPSHEWLGSIGERIEATGTVVTAFEFERASYYGDGYECATMVVLDTGVELIKWCTSKRVANGDKLTVRGTVKEHNIYRNARQTVIGRPHVKKSTG